VKGSIIIKRKLISAHDQDRVGGLYTRMRWQQMRQVSYRYIQLLIVLIKYKKVYSSLKSYDGALIIKVLIRSFKVTIPRESAMYIAIKGGIIRSLIQMRSG